MRGGGGARRDRMGLSQKDLFSFLFFYVSCFFTFLKSRLTAKTFCGNRPLGAKDLCRGERERDREREREGGGGGGGGGVGGQGGADRT